MAEEAYAWLYDEEPGTDMWAERQANEKSLTSFVSICEILSIDPSKMRIHIRKLTVDEVMNTGRHSDTRRVKERRQKTKVVVMPEQQEIHVSLPVSANIPQVVFAQRPAAAPEFMTRINCVLAMAADVREMGRKIQG